MLKLLLLISRIQYIFLYVYRGDSLTLSSILISLRGFLCLEFVTSTWRRYHVFPLGGFRVGIILTHLARNRDVLRLCVCE